MCNSLERPLLAASAASSEYTTSSASTDVKGSSPRHTMNTQSQHPLSTSRRDLSLGRTRIQTSSHTHFSARQELSRFRTGSDSKFILPTDSLPFMATFSLLVVRLGRWFGLCAAFIQTIAPQHFAIASFPCYNPIKSHARKPRMPRIAGRPGQAAPNTSTSGPQPLTVMAASEFFQLLHNEAEMRGYGKATQHDSGCMFVDVE